jgi:hypothetical protein
MDELKKLKKKERERLRTDVINAFRSEFITLSLILLLVTLILFTSDEIKLGIAALCFTVTTVWKIVDAYKADKQPR